MTTTNHNNLNDIIKISPSAKLKDEGIIEYFVKHKISNSLEIIVNHKVERNTVYVSSIDKKSLEDICKEVDKRLKEIGLDQNQRLLVKNTINNEWKLIIDLYDPCDTCEEPKNSNNNTNLIINYPNDDNEEQEKEGKIIDDESLETITPSQALRKDIAEYYKVNGTITSITKPFKMVLGIRFYCRRCKQSQEELFDLPEFDIPMFYSPTCKNCLFNGIPLVSKPPIFVNSINIEVQNLETFNDLESLPVFLFNEYTENIRVGERVEIPGVINIINTKKRHFTYFYGKSIKYLNREDYTLTKDDIRIIKRFREIHKDHIIDKLVEMFDPSIVENNLSKQGILMIAVNTSEKIGDDSEHLDGLFIGPPGLAKSKLLKRATELVPGSSNAGGQQYSTGKSLTAVIDKVNDNTILRLGIIPRSRGAICAINEFGRQNPEDQDKMLDVMQERGFNFSKYGMSTYIPAPTTILASANPINNDKWLDDDKIDLDQFPFLAPIIDRFDLIFPFTYKKSKKDNDDFIDKLAEIEAKKAKKQLPNYTQFLVKYIQYSKQINPVLTDEARSRLTEFSKGVLDKGFGSPRVIITLPKLVKSIARLKLKNVADEEDAKEVMEFYNAILVKFQKTVVIPQNPKDMAYWKGVEIVKRFRKFGGIRFEELIETLCKENRQLAIHFGYGERSLKMRHNSKVREVYGLLKNHSHIIIKDEKPVVLKWLACDTCDICDKDKISKNIQNEEKNNDEKTVENELEPRSHRSHISHISPNEEEQEDKEHEYGIKLGTDYKLPIHKVTEEQFRDLNENSRHNEGDSY